MKGVRLSDLTFRQYLASRFIYSKFRIEKRYPTKKEIIKIIEMKTDRMLEITLRALEKKGFIKFLGLNNNPIVEIPKENEKLFEIIADKLILLDEWVEYKEIKDRVVRMSNSIYSPRISVQQSLGASPKQLAVLNNEDKIIHRWYTYLQDFPPELVWNKLTEYGVNSKQIVLDPFVGSGTTLITAKLFGVDGIGIDINPVANFVTSCKTEWKIDRKNKIFIFGKDKFNLKELKHEADSVLNDYQKASNVLGEVRLKTSFMDTMPRMELNQWLETRTQNEVAFLKERIEEIENDGIKRLMLVALISSAVDSSNVSFCPGTSFYPFRKRLPFSTLFLEKLNAIYQDLFVLQRIDFQYGNSQVFNEDCRKASDYLNGQVDFIFTSPPYPNDLEYTRQTRLELFLLSYVANMDDVRKIKKKMVKGSTKLIFNDSNSAKYVEKFESVQKVANKIQEALSDKKWGWNYPRMVREYFGDIYLSLIEFKKILRRDSLALLVIGDQTYKQILIPVGKIIVELAKDLDYKSAKLELFRVRRSTTHKIPLREEIAILRTN